jgi:hypothetical protein
VYRRLRRELSRTGDFFQPGGNLSYIYAGGTTYGYQSRNQ